MRDPNVKLKDILYIESMDIVSGFICRNGNAWCSQHEKYTELWEIHPATQVFSGSRFTG